MPAVQEPWLTNVTIPRPKFEKASFEPEVEGFYRSVLEALDASGIPYLIGGAAALNHYTGIWRDTKDLDLFLEGHHVEAALGDLETLGCSVEVRDPLWLAKGYSPEGGLFVDLIHANSNGTFPVDGGWFDRARETQLLGRTVPVVAAEDILLSKVFVGSRDRWDGADVVHLLYRAGPSLDWDLLLRRGSEHWELLFSHLVLFEYAYPGARDRVPDFAWRALTERWTETVQAKAPLAEGFRGNLFDPISFNVDIDHWGLPDARAAARSRIPPAGGKYR